MIPCVLRNISWTCQLFLSLASVNMMVHFCPLEFGPLLFFIGVKGPVDDGQGVDITIPVTCSVFELDPMTSQ